ncbi:serine protease [Vibrio diabolicus]|uniref:serine protease n=1 Tax=Vibrio diabolicus TaxID=50719 RepID=UPI002160C896|nr:serine protease [Vibrio diabolicus]MCS0383827.1 serine protease [Vibrio diabolicus]
MSYTYQDIIGACQYPIVGRNKSSKKWEVVGTCVLLGLEERYFLLTAAHVMNERHNVLDNILWLWNHADGSKTTINEDIVGNPNENTEHWSDYAVIEINIHEYPNLNPNQAVRLEHVALDLDAQNDAIGFSVTGYPSSQNKIVGNISKQPKMYTILTSAYGTSKYPTLIELEFSNEMLAEKTASLPKPQGMSGGGVWKVTEKSKELKLVGLSVACQMKEKKVLAINIGVILSMIKFSYSNTILDFLDLPIQIKGDDLIAQIYVPLKTI